MRDIRSERVLPPIDDVLDLFAIAQQTKIHQARLIPEKLISTKFNFFEFLTHQRSITHRVFWKPAFPQVII